MFNNPRFARQPGAGNVGPVSGIRLPNIHESYYQNIQGGQPGEHYHISAELYQALIDRAGVTVRTEVVCSALADIMYSKTGDAMHQLIYTTDLVFPDVVSGIVDGSEPPPEGTDTYWNNVVAATKANAIPIVSVDQYASNIAIAGSAELEAFVSTTYPVFGTEGTLEVINPFATPSYPFFFAEMRQYGGTQPSLGANFTIEQHLAMGTGAGDDRLVFAVGDSNRNFALIIDPNGTAIFQDEGPTGTIHDSETFVYNWTSGQQHHYCIERNANLVRLYIDGVQVASLESDALLVGRTYSYAHAYGPLRATKSTARYSGNFTAPITYYPEA